MRACIHVCVRTYMCVCVHVCVRAYVCVCVCVCAGVCESMCVCEGAGGGGVFLTFVPGFMCDIFLCKVFISYYDYYDRYWIISVCDS